MSRAHPNYLKGKAELKILSTARQTILAHTMIQTGDAVLVAVSGGPDSVALLHILQTLAPEYSLRIGIAHLNHCLRKSESDRDADFVHSLGRRLKLPCYIAKEDVRSYQRRHQLSLEDAARRVRYKYLDHIAEAKAFNKIALGHHGDDNAELVLMYLLRGSGSLGLSGIPPMRGEKIVRPLINLMRSEILAYIAEKNLDYVSDTSNLDPSHLRNKLRHELLPLLKSSYNPKICQALNRLAAIASADEQWIAELIQPVFEKTLQTKTPDRIVLSRELLGQLPKATARRVIRRTLSELIGDLRKIGFSHVDSVVQLAKSDRSCGYIDLPARIRIRSERRTLAITREESNLRISHPKRLPSKFPDYEYEIIKPGKLHIKEAGCYLEFTRLGIADLPDLGHTGQHIAFFDINMLEFPLVIRNFRPGDRFSPLGMTGSQKVQKFFSNNKVSMADRKRCPLLVSRGKILWVAGYRLDNSAKLKPETRSILKAELSDQ
jgi:tRNA(Ile)-lysidine synthase